MGCSYIWTLGTSNHSMMLISCNSQTSTRIGINILFTQISILSVLLGANITCPRHLVLGHSPLPPWRLSKGGIINSSLFIYLLFLFLSVAKNYPTPSNHSLFYLLPPLNTTDSYPTSFSSNYFLLYLFPYLL
jgi:hypothetical protein